MNGQKSTLVQLVPKKKHEKHKCLTLLLDPPRSYPTHIIDKDLIEHPGSYPCYAGGCGL